MAGILFDISIIALVGSIFPFNMPFPTYLKGGFLTIKHNEIHDLIAVLLKKVCHEVQIEPTLQPLPGNILIMPQQWGSLECFYEHLVLLLLCSNSRMSTRIWDVEHGTFTPPVF